MTEGELLERIAHTLRKEIGPALEQEYPKTQAFMASVVAQKLGRQIDLSAAHAAAAKVALDTMLAALAGADGVPVAVTAAIKTVEQDRSDASLAQLIEVLYKARDELGEARFAELLGHVRGALRSAIDRRMEYAA